jgi:subtilase family serine protease
MVVFRFLGRAARRRDRTLSIALEQLEDRCMPSANPGVPSAITLSPTYVLLQNGGNQPLDMSGSPAGYSPAQMRHAYGFDQISFPSGGNTVAGDGTGQTIAIVDAYDDPNITSDLATFDTKFGLPAPNFVKVGIDANGNASTTSFPSPNSGWAVEISLDVEWAHSIAPGANIVLVEAYSNSFNDLANAILYANSRAGTSVVSMSWGGGEFSGDNQLDYLFSAPSGHNPITYTASSGDNGASAGIIWPSVSSHVVGVGGTTLNLDSSGNPLGETAWSGSGGGISKDTSAPGYQNNLTIYSGDPQANGMRAVPDVAYDANPSTGVPVYDTYGYGGWLEVGGTSAGAPQWAALIAIADQGRALDGLATLDGYSQTLPDLYAAPNDFTDITSGSNGYPAGPGFDDVTGLGSPLANKLMSALGVQSQILTSVTITPSNPTIQDGTSIQFTAVGYDQFGKRMVPQPSFSWQLLSGQGSVNGTGLYTAPASGMGTDVVQVAATENGFTVKGTTNVSYNPGPVISGLTANPNPVTSTTTTLSATLSDFNPGSMSYTWSVVSAPSGAQTPTLQPPSGSTTPGLISSTATFFDAGAYEFQLSVTDALGFSTSGVVWVTVNQTVTTVTVTPGTATLQDGGQQQFSAAAYDQFGNAFAPPPSFTWSVAGAGTVNSTGLYSAPNTGSGTDTVYATATVNGNSATGSATVTYNSGPTISGLAANPNPVTGTTTTLSATLADSNPGSMSYTWSVLSEPSGAQTPTLQPPSGSTNPGIISSTATFFDAGAYEFQLSVTDALGFSTSGVVWVTVNQTVTTVTVTPGTATLQDGGQQQFSAAAYDQFGNAFASPPSFTWSVSGAGTVNSTGLYSAPNTGSGTDTVYATASVNGNSATGSATVTYTASLAITSLTINPDPVIGTTGTLIATVTDGSASWVNYTWSVVSIPPGAQPPQLSTYSGSAPIGTLTNPVTFYAPGSYEFQLVVSDSTGASATATLTVTVEMPGPAITSLTVNPNPVVGMNGTLIAQVTDPTYAFVNYTWSVVSTPPGAPAPQLTYTNGMAPVGTLTNPVTFYAPGTYAFQLMVSDASGQSATDTVSVNVLGQTPTVTLSATPNPVTGTTTTLTGTVSDPNESTPNYLYSWSVVSAPPGVPTPTFTLPPSGQAFSNTIVNTATFYAAGAYQFQLSITDTFNVSASNTTTVTVLQTLTTVTLTPATVTLGEGGLQKFSAQATDQFQKPMSPQPSFSWSVISGPGTINSTGLYTAPTNTTGTAIVQGAATVNGVTVSGTATVTVVAAPVITSITANPNPITGTTTTLKVVATDPAGGALTYLWSVLSWPAGASPPTIQSNRSATTGAIFSAAGSYTFKVVVTSKLTGLSTTGTVSATVLQTLTRVTITPSSAMVKHGTTLQLAAFAYDQFLNPITTTFTWSMMSGPGSVNSQGLYFAPSTGTGRAVVRATATYNGVTLSGTTTLTIT